MKLGRWVIGILIVAVLAAFVTNPRFRSLIGLSQSQTVSVQRSVAPEQVEEQIVEQVVEQEYEMITLLPLDGIPSIDDPQFVTGAEADEQYGEDELVIGVEIDGDARAYSIPFLSGHEIVNDVVAGKPIAVTW